MSANSQNSSSLNLDFEKYFADVYKQRWPGIFQALRNPEKQICRQNLFSTEASGLSSPFIDGLDGCHWRTDKNAIEKDNSGLARYYVMDPASVIVARSLSVQPEHNVLDMCAAPGGKSLILAEAMSFQNGKPTEPSGSFVVNEMSNERRARLTSILQSYIPRDRRQFLAVKGLDGNQYGLRQPDTFDRILADVPCSGERHLIENPSEFENWTIKRSKNLAVRQYSLAASAWLALKLGGEMVYSTCSLSPLENDDVISKLVKKKKVQVLRTNQWADFKQVEPTEFGYQILPDVAEFGPMYFAIVKKI